MEVTYTVASKESLEASYQEALTKGTELEFAASCANHGLFPPSLIKAREKQQSQSYRKILILVLNFFLLSCCFYWAEQAAHLKVATTQIALLLSQQKKIMKASACLLSTTRDLKKEGASLAHLVQEQSLWPTLLNELHHQLPPRFVWITKLSPLFEKQPSKKGSGISKNNNLEIDELTDDKVNALAIEGLYLENPRQAAVVSDWVEALKKSPLFALKGKKEEEIILSCLPPDPTTYASPFKLLLPLSLNGE